jgi:hypothetical protein
MSLLPLSSVFGKGANALHVYARTRAERRARVATLPVIAQIGLECLMRRGEHGAISALGQQYGVDRDFVTDCERRVIECLSLLDGHQASPGQFSMTVQVDREQLVRATVAARVEANCSIRGIMALHEHFYGLDVSFGWVQGVTSQAAHLASSELTGVRLDKIESAALDELFGQGEPVLIGIDLDSEYLFLLEHVGDRSGRTWETALSALKSRGLHLKRFVSDAGKGVCAGAEWAYPQASSRRAPFHLLDVLFDVLRREERYASAKLAELFAQEDEVKRLSAVVDSLLALPHDRRGRPKKTKIEEQLHEKQAVLSELRARTDASVERHDKILSIINEVMEVLEFVDLQGQLRRSEPAAARLKVLADELEALRGKQVKKAATYLRNCAEPVCRYISETTARLKALTDDARSMRVVEQTAVLWRLSKEEEKRFFAWRRHERLKETQAALDALACSGLDDAVVKTLMTQTIEVIEKRARAESLAECVGAVLRPYLAVHKRVTQEALDLFCYWWNFHRRTTGRLKGSCPFTKMTGIKVHDWLTYLGLPQSSQLH